MANRQVWQVSDDSTGTYDLNNPKVTVRRAAFGSYMLDIEGARRASGASSSNPGASRARRSARLRRLSRRSPSARSTAGTESALLDALKTVIDPTTGKDFVSTRFVKNLRIDGGDIAFAVELGYPGKS